jgi:hypothetical protein
MSVNTRQRGISAVRQCWRLIMVTRSRRETVTFKHSFRIRGIDRLLSAGAYDAQRIDASASRE